MRLSRTHRVLALVLAVPILIAGGVRLSARSAQNPPAEKLSAEARYWAQVSSSLDFSAPDKADPEKLTKVLWHHTHGPEAYPPADASRG